MRSASVVGGKRAGHTRGSSIKRSKTVLKPIPAPTSSKPSPRSSPQTSNVSRLTAHGRTESKSVRTRSPGSNIDESVLEKTAQPVRRRREIRRHVDYALFEGMSQKYAEQRDRADELQAENEKLRASMRKLKTSLERVKRDAEKEQSLMKDRLSSRLHEYALNSESRIAKLETDYNEKMKVFADETRERIEKQCRAEFEHKMREVNDSAQRQVAKVKKEYSERNDRLGHQLTSAMRVITQLEREKEVAARELAKALFKKRVLAIQVTDALTLTRRMRRYRHRLHMALCNLFIYKLKMRRVMRRLCRMGVECGKVIQGYEKIMNDNQGLLGRSGFLHVPTEVQGWFEKAKDLVNAYRVNFRPNTLFSTRSTEINPHTPILEYMKHLCDLPQMMRTGFQRACKREHAWEEMFRSAKKAEAESTCKRVLYKEHVDQLDKRIEWMRGKYEELWVAYEGVFEHIPKSKIRRVAENKDEGGFETTDNHSPERLRVNHRYVRVGTDRLVPVPTAVMAHRVLASTEGPPVDVVHELRVPHDPKLRARTASMFDMVPDPITSELSPHDSPAVLHYKTELLHRSHPGMESPRRATGAAEHHRPGESKENKGEKKGVSDSGPAPASKNDTGSGDGGDEDEVAMYTYNDPFEDEESSAAASTTVHDSDARASSPEPVTNSDAEPRSTPARRRVSGSAGGGVPVPSLSSSELPGPSKRRRSRPLRKSQSSLPLGAEQDGGSPAASPRAQGQDSADGSRRVRRRRRVSRASYLPSIGGGSDSDGPRSLRTHSRARSHLSIRKVQLSSQLPSIRRFLPKHK